VSTGASETGTVGWGWGHGPVQLRGPLRRALAHTSAVLDLVDEESPLLPKVLGESAMLVLAAAPLRDYAPWLRDVVDTLAAKVSAGTRTPETAMRILLEPAHALDHASAHILLTSAGYPDDTFQLHVDSALRSRSGATCGPERLPHRELEQQWFGRLLGEPAPDDLEAAVLACSALGRPLDALAATRLDVYAFTHCVMYAHDLGGRRPDLPRRPEEVIDDAEAGLALAMDSGDLDLAVELLLTWPLLGVPLGPTATYVLAHVLETEERLGFLPGLGYDADHDQSELLLANYHPATVMGLFAALAIRECTTVASAPAPRVGSDSLSGLAAAWHGPVPAFVADAELSLNGATALPLVLTAGLRNAVAHVDLASVRALLTVALELDLADGPAVGEAAALITRMSRGMPRGQAVRHGGSLAGQDYRTGTPARTKP
jgi:hypothetical protein